MDVLVLSTVVNSVLVIPESSASMINSCPALFDKINASAFLPSMMNRARPDSVSLEKVIAESSRAPTNSD